MGIPTSQTQQIVVLTPSGIAADAPKYGVGSFASPKLAVDKEPSKMPVILLGAALAGAFFLVRR